MLVLLQLLLQLLCLQPTAMRHTDECKKLWQYISHLVAYLLTYLLLVSVPCWLISHVLHVLCR